MSAACTNGESLFTLNRVDRLRIVFDLPESAAALIELGQSVELTLDSLKDQMFHAEVKRTAGQLDKRARKELRPLSFSNPRWVNCEPTSGLLPDEPTGADDHRVQ
jgi:hypothetical protein